MPLMDKVVEELRSLSEAELEQVAEYLAFLKFRARHHVPALIDETQVAGLYAQFAEEDRQLAEEGMHDYYAQLQREDAE